MTDPLLKTAVSQSILNMRDRMIAPNGAASTDRVSVSNEHADRLENACREFEALFINFLLKEMRATVDKSGFMGGGRAEELYTSMMDNQMAKELSVGGGIGIASILYRQLAGGSTISEKENPIQVKKIPKTEILEREHILSPKHQQKKD